MKNLILKLTAIVVSLTLVFGVYKILDTYLTHEQSFAVLVASSLIVCVCIFYKVYGFNGARNAINR